jgi:hypothetical protein
MVRKIFGYVLLGWVIAVGIKIVDIYAEELLEGSPLELSAEVSVYSDYLWRGFLLDSDPVMQQGIHLSAHAFTASIWGSFDIDSDDALNSDEVDYAIDYTYERDNLTLSVGHTYYDFPGTDGKSREFYIGGGLNLALSPSLTWYHDYGEEGSGGGDGDYIVLNLGYSFLLNESPITLELSGHVGYNDKLFINGEGVDVAVGCGLTIPLTDNCSLSPNIGYSIPFGDLEDTDDGNQDNKFYGGFTLTFSL